MAKKPSGGSGDSEDPTISYEVGYGRPPIESRFQPGQSGNPKGRQKRQRNLKTVVQEELDKLIDLTEGHRKRRVTKAEAFGTMLVNNAIKGCPKAAATLLRTTGVADDDPKLHPDQPLTAFDDALVADFLRRSSPQGSDEPSDGGES